MELPSLFLTLANLSLFLPRDLEVDKYTNAEDRISVHVQVLLKDAAARATKDRMKRKEGDIILESHKEEVVAKIQKQVVLVLRLLNLHRFHGVGNGGEENGGTQVRRKGRK